MLNTAKKRFCSHRSDSSGFTLIEILVALVILSIGLLGVAGFQFRSLQNSHVSYERSIVTLQAQDLVERMWAGICSLYDANQNLVPSGQVAIWNAWRLDHEADGTFANQSWAPVLTPPASGTHVWTITIGWTGRFQGQPEQVVHHFRLPPPLRPDTCP